MSRNFDCPIAKVGPTIGSVMVGSFWSEGDVFKVEDVSLDPDVERSSTALFGYFLCTEGLYPSTHCVVHRCASLFRTHLEPCGQY